LAGMTQVPLDDVWILHIAREMGNWVLISSRRVLFPEPLGPPTMRRRDVFMCGR
jgi:hypothetical protein